MAAARIRPWAVPVAAVALLALAGCSGVPDGGSPIAPEAAHVAPVAATVSSQAVRPAAPVAAGTQLVGGERLRFKVATGTKVALVRLDTGVRISGKLQKGRWISAPLPPRSRYRLTVTTAAGTTNTLVRTGAAAQEMTASISPVSGSYGVGMPLTVTFSQDVADRDAVESALTVRTSRPVLGAWSWTGARTVVFRPRTYWPGNTRVAVRADLEGVSAGDGVWGRGVAKSDIKIGRKLIVRVTNATHQAKVYIGGKVVRTMPVSMGKSGFTTRSGIKVFAEKYLVKRMTNQGVTNDEVYDLQVPYAMRLTASGEFLHAAPWNGNIGYANTSHGCTNLHLDDAIWMYQRVLVGDVLETSGTGRSMENWNGLGGPWAESWKTWLHDSGTGKHMTIPFGR